MPRICLGCWAVVISSVFAASAVGQCAPQWRQTTPAIPGTNGWVESTTWWDPDGAGPRGQVLVVAGSFTAAGTVPSFNIAAFDPATGSWSALGAGIGGFVHSLVVLPSGELVAAGNFQSPGRNIAKWNGSAWSTLGAGVGMRFAIPGGEVYTTIVLQNGDLCVGGVFEEAGTVPANCIATWNGTSWAASPPPLNNSFLGIESIRCLAQLANGNIVAGGSFTNSLGAVADNIARWNGTAWAGLGAGLNSRVDAVLAMPNGDVIAGGRFTAAGVVQLNRVARWNGTAWQNMSGMPAVGRVASLAVMPNGTIIAGGDIADSIRSWNGSTWVGLTGGTLNGSTLTLSVSPAGQLIAGGEFGVAGSTQATRVASWSGVAWTSISSGGVNPFGAAQAILPWNGAVLTAHFPVVMQWNGASQPLGGGFYGTVTSLARSGNGTLLAGQFAFGGPTSVPYVSRWTGASWTAVAGTPTKSITAMTTMADGSVVVAGDFTAPGNHIARWNGATWSQLGGGLLTGANALLALPNGELWAGGVALTTSTNFDCVARWNGTAWQSMGGQQSGVGTVLALGVRPNGDIVAGGNFSDLGGIAMSGVARWNGASWIDMSPGILLSSVDYVRTLACLPNGDVVIGGGFRGFTGPGAHIARWDGTAWHSIGSGTDGEVTSLLLEPDGRLWVGGSFTVVDGRVSPVLASIDPTCPATATVGGVGCTGPSGPNVLTAVTRPWIGATFRSQATGISSTAWTLAVVGAVPTFVPLVSVFPTALPGCAGLVLPDIAYLMPPTSGVHEIAIDVPATSSLIGLVAHQQMAAAEIDAFGSLGAISSTNSLVLTIGSL